MIKNCPMRHENGNCLPAGGFCTANKNICEALRNAYRLGKAQLSQESTTSDLISRQDAIEKFAMTAPQMSVIRIYEAVEILESMQTIQPVATDTNVRSSSEIPNTSDCISRQAAIDALCKALYDYEDKTEKQFMESDELDVGDWIEHRIFVQNMNDIDRQTILNLPPAQPEPHEGHWIDKGWNGDWAWQIDGRGNCWRVIECSECGKSVSAESNYCPHCGAKMTISK